MNTHQEWERRAAQAGYRPSEKRVCPRVVAGLACTWDRPGRCCGCPAGGHSGTFYDHPRLWRDEVTGELVLTSEPYNLDGGRLAAYIAQMAELDLEVTVYGDSWWNPGRTFRITISRKGHGFRRWEASHGRPAPQLP